MTTPRDAAWAQVRLSVVGSPAWKPQATFALVTTSSIASSSPSRQRPNDSPRSALRSMRTATVLRSGRDDAQDLVLAIPVRCGHVQDAVRAHLRGMQPAVGVLDAGHAGGLGDHASRVDGQ